MLAVGSCRRRFYPLVFSAFGAGGAPMVVKIASYVLHTLNILQLWSHPNGKPWSIKKTLLIFARLVLDLRSVKAKQLNRLGRLFAHKSLICCSSTNKPFETSTFSCASLSEEN